jgi:hypothetical protein
MTERFEQWRTCGRDVVSLIELRDEPRSCQERVRLLSPNEGATRVGGAGLEVLGRSGDHDGTPPTADRPRVVLLARRP